MDHGSRVIAVVSVLDDRVKKVGKDLQTQKEDQIVLDEVCCCSSISYLVALLVSSHTAHCLDERVPGVVHSRLDALVQGPVVGGDLVPQSGVNGRRQRRGHAVVVLPQVGEVRAMELRINCTVIPLFGSWCGFNHIKSSF